MLQAMPIPTFTLSSADTPSPIIYDNSKLDTSVGAVTPEEQAEVIANSPMEDMVRVWQAPAAGIVNISGEVRLLKPTGDFDQSEYDKADGVRVAIQKGGTELWQKMIAKGDETGYPATASISLFKKVIRFISVYSPAIPKRVTVHSITSLGHRK